MAFNLWEKKKKKKKGNFLEMEKPYQTLKCALLLLLLLLLLFMHQNKTADKFLWKEWPVPKSFFILRNGTSL